MVRRIQPTNSINDRTKDLSVVSYLLSNIGKCSQLVACLNLHRDWHLDPVSQEMNWIQEEVRAPINSIPLRRGLKYAQIITW
jgi:hypothetical protein